MRHLVITNGDCAADLMRSAGFEAEIIAWRDVLHEGQVDSRLDLESLSRVRARHIASLGWGDLAQVSLDFQTRDSVLKDWKAFDHIELWFEHDLYDQLQVLQILNFFSRTNILDSATTLSLLDSTNYLGRCSSSSILSLKSKLKPVSLSQLKLASDAWLAFGGINPMPWHDLRHRDLSALPYLKSCVTRIMQEYPNLQTGLSRSEFQALKTIASGIRKPYEVFAACQKLEESIYMGDLSFFVVLNSLLNKPEPLIESSLKGQSVSLINHALHQLSITSKGRHVLDSTSSLKSKHLVWPRWLGGVYLDKHTVWRWDDKHKLLIDLSAVSS